MRTFVLLAGLIAGLGSGLTPTGVVDAFTSGENGSLIRIEPPLTSFRAYRRLEAANRRFKTHGWMDVVTELADGRVLTVEVIAEGGSALIRDRVLRPVLDGERQLLARADPGRTALSTDNYAVMREAVQGEDMLQLTVKALRQEITLVNGTVDVTRDGHDLVQVAGRLAKSPSFWVSRVEVVRRYARIVGVRVPVQVESTAHVRFAGPSAMTMTYRYETINGRAVPPPEMGVQPVASWARE